MTMVPMPCGGQVEVTGSLLGESESYLCSCGCEYEEEKVLDRIRAGGVTNSYTCRACGAKPIIEGDVRGITHNGAAGCKEALWPIIPG